MKKFLAIVGEVLLFIIMLPVVMFAVGFVMEGLTQSRESYRLEEKQCKKESVNLYEYDRCMGKR